MVIQFKTATSKNNDAHSCITWTNDQKD